MRALLASLAVALLFASGCLDSGKSDQTAQAGQDTDAQDQADYSGDAAGDDGTSSGTLYLAGPDDLGDFALALSIDFGGKNSCDIEEENNNEFSGGGPDAITLEEHDGSFGWGYGSSGDLASAHAGPVDTRRIAESGGGGGSGSAVRGSFDGVWNFTVLGRGFKADPRGYFSTASLALSFECSSTFEVLQARAGHAVALVDGASSEGGAGAAVFIAGDASAQDTATLDATAAIEAEAECAAFGAETARVELAYPGGTDSWLFAPDLAAQVTEGFQRQTGGPGTYTLTMDHAGAYFNAFWCGGWASEGPFDLTPWMRDERPFKGLL